MSAALAIRDDLAREMKAELRCIPEPAKVIALKVGITQRSVESHRAGEIPEAWTTLVNYGRLYPQVRKLLNRLMDAEAGESGENPSIILYEIQRLVAQKLAGRR